MDCSAAATYSRESGLGRSRNIVGRPLMAVESILLPESPEPIGLRLIWIEASVLILNWGDEVMVSEQWPAYLRDANAKAVPVG